MTTVVACRIPHGLKIDHAVSGGAGEHKEGVRTITLNGPNIGVNPELMVPNGNAVDTEDRANGFGLTVLDGDDEAAFLDWAKVSKFAAFDTGDIVFAKNEADVRKETAKAVDGGQISRGMDPDKDLPAGVETAKDDKKGK